MPRFSDCWRCGTTVDVAITCQLCDVAKYCSEECQKNDIFRHEVECIPASIINTCKACRKSGPHLKTCSRCYRVFYCDLNCQKANWQRHKIDCNEVKENIQELTQHVLEVYVESGEKSFLCDFHYWGNVPAFDCLNLVENEGAAYDSELKVLYLGVGDLRNVVLTCASLPDTNENNISFTLNDREGCVLARLVLLLYILSKGDQGIEKTVTEIWYSILLSEATYKSLRVSLEELVGFTSAKILREKTSDLISIDENHFKDLQLAWEIWLGMHVQGTKWIQTQRKRRIDSYYDAVDKSGYLGNIPAEHTASAKKWIDDGVFKRTQAPAFAENPTLTGFDDTISYFSAEYSYCLPASDTPWAGWDYLQVKKFKSSDCLVTMYGEYIECILRSIINKVINQQISFKIVLCDCVKIKRHLELETVYDRILTSNLMDYIFLPDLLKLCSDMLNHDNCYATIVTETLLWIRDINQKGGFQWPANRCQVPKLTKIALEDTKRSSFATDYGVSFMEYLDNTNEFLDTLRSLFHAHSLRIAMKSDTTPKIPFINELGNEFQLRLREVKRNENRIVFFRPAINRRRINWLEGKERVLEWVPLKKK